METRFILPVAVATALHAFVFLGVKWPHVQRHDVPPVVADAMKPLPIPVDLEPPEKSDVFDEISTPQPQGRAEEIRPELEEAPPRPGVFEQTQSMKRPAPVNVVTRISSDSIGVPDGVEGAKWSDVQIFSAEVLDNPPRSRSQVAPAYPAVERNAGITGEVLVEFMVDENGRVAHARVIRSSSAAFESSTLRAVERWRFEPGKKDGRAVRFRMIVPVHFSLET